jgi:transaldolase
MQELIAPHTVNTLPPDTLEAFLDHGEVKIAPMDNLDQVNFVLQSLSSLGISMDQVTQELEDEGVDAFARSFQSLMQSIETKRQAMHSQVS